MVLTVVVPTTIQTTVQGGTTTSVFGQSVTFTATVSDAGGTPTGTVTFEDGGSVLGSGPVNASGVATFTTKALALGPTCDNFGVQRRQQVCREHFVRSSTSP